MYLHGYTQVKNGIYKKNKPSTQDRINKDCFPIPFEHLQEKQLLPKKGTAKVQSLDPFTDAGKG